MSIFAICFWSCESGSEASKDCGKFNYNREVMVKSVVAFVKYNVGNYRLAILISDIETDPNFYIGACLKYPKHFFNFCAKVRYMHYSNYLIHLLTTRIHCH